MKFRAVFSTSVAIVAFGALMLGSESRADAGVIFTFTQSGSDVVESGSGTINLSALTLVGGTVFGATPLDASLGVACVGDPFAALDIYRGALIGPSNFGPGGLFSSSSGAGQEIALSRADDEIFVPSGYTSGEALSGTVSFTGQTLASLGLTVGTYTWVWGIFPNADFFKVVVGSGIAATPEPSTALFIALPLAVMLLKLRRQRLAISSPRS